LTKGRIAPAHDSSLKSGGASTSRQSYVSCNGYQSADEWNSSYPLSSTVRWPVLLLFT